MADQSAVLSAITAGMAAGAGDVSAQLEESTERLNSLLERAEAAKQRVDAQGAALGTASSSEQLKVVGNTPSSSSVKTEGWDWSSAYTKWEGYEDLDDLNSAIVSERGVRDKLLEGSHPAQHMHDHSEERRFFERPEKEKLRECERYRALGNGLYGEGLLPKAAHMYKTALSYYEYCFPLSDEDQQVLDELRRACLCNISLCYSRMGEHRQAQEAAGKVLRASPSHAKSLYRRACSFRALDEYDQAQADLTMALESCPGDTVLLAEQEALFMQMKGARNLEREMAPRLLAEKQSVSSVVQGQAVKQQQQLQHVFSSDHPLEPFMPSSLRSCVGAHER